jgi:hypothetical protein
MPWDCEIGHRALIITVIVPNMANYEVNLVIDWGIWVSPFKIIREGSFIIYPRSEPDSGNPTVRVRRGASGNVNLISARLNSTRQLLKHGSVRVAP